MYECRIESSENSVTIVAEDCLIHSTRRLKTQSGGPRHQANMASATENSTGFKWPREYFFPPFFTRQPNSQTHHAQLLKWSALFLGYCQHHRIFKPSLSGASTTTPAAVPGVSGSGAATAEELFYNQKIDRRLHQRMRAR